MADGLADLPEVALRQAGAAALKSCRFFPPVAELRELAGFGEAGAEGRQDAEATAAYAEATRWAKRHAGRLYGAGSGRYRWPEDADERLAEIAARAAYALRMVGGVDRVMSARDAESEKWLRKEFIEAYRIAPETAEASARMIAGNAGNLALSLAQRLSLPEAR